METNRILRDTIEDSLTKAKKVIHNIADSVSNVDTDDSLEHVIAAIVKTMLAPERELSSTDIENFRMVWGKNFPARDVDKIVAFLYDSTIITISEAAAALNLVEGKYLKKIFAHLSELISCADSAADAEKFLSDLAPEINLSEKEKKSILLAAKNKSEKRKKILRSGAGILAALIILLIFILTATWLKSVIFGLILAFLMLPVEQYFERKFERKKGLLYHFFNLYGHCEGSIKNKFKLSASNIRMTAAEKKKYERNFWIRNSVTMSCLVLILIVGLICGFFFSLSADYLRSTRQNIKNFLTVPAEKNTAVSADNKSAAPANSEKETFDTVIFNIQSYLDSKLKNFESNTLIKNIIGELSNVLKNPDTQQEIFSLMLKKTGGLVNLTTGIFNAICTFLLDVLLTIFFFLLFLSKLAQFTKLRRNKNENYIVRTLFSGNWLPRTNEEDIAETELIISEIGHKLKVWLRGFLLLMLIDFTVYSTVFYFLNVPYFLILGAIAGCGILLPFIGPIVSCVLTCLITLACGDASALQLLGVVLIYLLHNGITEQFILYPTVIGESLGLTALETIIVVLLGGIFAGVTGMIFSIPTAAVIKYLVPRIYHYLQPAK